MQYILSYRLTGPDGVGSVPQAGSAQIGEATFDLTPETGDYESISWRDVLRIRAADYRLELLLSTGETLELSDLGYRYEDFIRQACRARSELILHDMLMGEKIRLPGVEAEFSRENGQSGEVQKGRALLRLYETALVLLVEDGEPWRIPYGDLIERNAGDYALTLKTEAGEKIVLSQMGREFDPFGKALAQAQADLEALAQETVRMVWPLGDPASRRRAARYLREGRAARQADLAGISPQLWEALENKIASFGLGEEYGFLRGLAPKERICAGLKRGLVEQAGDYLWFLTPIYGEDPAGPGNAVAMEAGSAGGQGRATYFFRIMSRKEYAKPGSREAVEARIDSLLAQINRGMIEINFRREPIYLPEQALTEPQYQHYLFAVRLLPALRLLRDLFIGRVVHSSFEQWRDNVMDLLEFNTKAGDDGLRWTSKDPEVSEAD